MQGKLFKNPIQQMHKCICIFDQHKSLYLLTYIQYGDEVKTDK